MMRKNVLFAALIFIILLLTRFVTINISIYNSIIEFFGYFLLVPFIYYLSAIFKKNSKKLILYSSFGTILSIFLVKNIDFINVLQNLVAIIWGAIFSYILNFKDDKKRNN